MALMPVTLNITDNSSIAAAIQTVSNQAGYIDILINNVGLGILTVGTI